ncbi:MAG: Txe/YoeB family addiction module toxin [Bacteroidaceae bacterium]|nr:Txe/YoeB family addiction module toxin [Bacteroidaceae bacterium]
MSYRIEFSQKAQKVIKKWKKSNPVSFKKLYDLLPELEEHPRTGSAHPEPLVGGKNITYSRRLSGRDRVIYDVYDDRVVVLVISVEGHYEDK